MYVLWTLLGCDLIAAMVEAAGKSSMDLGDTAQGPRDEEPVELARVEQSEASDTGDSSLP